MRDSIFSFYTTRKARFSAYAGFALIACCYIGINSLWLHRPERIVSYEVSALLAAMVFSAPFVYHFIEQDIRVVFQLRQSRHVERRKEDFRKHLEIMAQLKREVTETEQHMAIELQKYLSLRLLIANDQETTRLLRTVFKQRGWEVVAEASSGREVLEKAASLKPDVVLMDIQMPGFSGLEIVREITKNLSDTKVILLDIRYSASTERKALEAGAIEYLQKENLDPFELVELIRRAKFPLTLRQQIIIRLIARGLSYKAIANQLKLSEQEVKIESHKITHELNLLSPQDVVNYAHRHKLV